jgi:hypothetical protein
VPDRRTVTAPARLGTLRGPGKPEAGDTVWEAGVTLSEAGDTLSEAGDTVSEAVGSARLDTVRARASS